MSAPARLAFRPFPVLIFIALASGSPAGAAPPLPGSATPEDENRDSAIFAADDGREIGKERVRARLEADGSWRFSAERLYGDGSVVLEEQIAVLGRELRPLRYRLFARGADGRATEDITVRYGQAAPTAAVRAIVDGEARERVVEYEDGPPYLGLLVSFGIRSALSEGREDFSYGTLVFRPFIASLDIDVRRDAAERFPPGWSGAPRVRLEMRADLGLLASTVADLFAPRPALWFEDAPPRRFSRYVGLPCPWPQGPEVRIEPIRVLGPGAGAEDELPRPP